MLRYCAGVYSHTSLPVRGAAGYSGGGCGFALCSPGTFSVRSCGQAVKSCSHEQAHRNLCTFTKQHVVSNNMSFRPNPVINGVSKSSINLVKSFDFNRRDTTASAVCRCSVYLTALNSVPTYSQFSLSNPCVVSRM